MLAAALLAGCGGDSTIVDSEDIADGAVTTPKLADGAVAADKLGQDVKDALAEAGANLKATQVGTDKLKDAAVTAPKLAAAAVTAEKIAEGAVKTKKIAGGAVTGAKVQDGSLTGADIDGSTIENVNAASLRGKTDYLRDVSKVSKASPSNATAYKGPVVATCPSGRTLVGGGANVVSASGSKLRVALFSSGPSGNGWSATAFEVVTTSDFWSLEAVAICAVVPA